MSIFTKIKNLGVDGSLPEYINKKIVLTNTINMVLIATAIFYVFFYGFLGIIKGSIILSIGAIILLFSYLLNSSSYHVLGRMLVVFISILIVCSIEILLYDTKDTQYWSLGFLMVPLNILPFLVFDSREGKIQFFGMAFTIFISLISPFTFDIIPTDFDNSFYLSNTFNFTTVCTGLIFMIVFLMIYRNEIYSTILQNESIIKESERKTRQINEAKIESDKLLAEVKQAQYEDQRRAWINNGINQLLSILRFENKELNIFDDVLTEMIHHTEALQGAIFLYNTELKVLESKSFYAYDRKKFLEKTILPGEGLVGLCYLEKEPIILTEIPEEYGQISTGLGEAQPTFIVLYPLMNNQEVVGVVEIGFFHEPEQSVIKYIERASENIGSMISSVLLNLHMKKLIEDSIIQTEALKAQEEELKQNLEEMQASQEEMLRKEREYIRRIKDLEEKIK